MAEVLFILPCSDNESEFISGFISSVSPQGGPQRAFLILLSSGFPHSSSAERGWLGVQPGWRLAVLWQHLCVFRCTLQWRISSRQSALEGLPGGCALWPPIHVASAHQPPSAACSLVSKEFQWGCMSTCALLCSGAPFGFFF